MFLIAGHDMLPINHWQKVVNGTLIIEKVQKLHDVGKYTCTAQNREGQRDTRDVFVSVVGKWYYNPRCTVTAFKTMVHHDKTTSWSESRRGGVA